MKLQRRLSLTPLHKRHARRMKPAGSRGNIPWDRFDRSRFSEGALAAAEDSLRGLAAGEYSATALFGLVAAGLVLHGSPYDLVSEAAAIPADEIRHAEYAERFLSLVRGEEVGMPSIDVAVDLHRKNCTPPATVEDLDVLMLELPAMRETIAAAMLSASAEMATDATARAFYRNIVRDEIHHSRLGWYYLEWRSPQWSLPERQRIADRAGEVVVTLEERFSRGRDVATADAADSRRLGVLDTVAQSEAIRRLMEDEMVPALDRLGLGASHAWRVRRRFEPSGARKGTDG